MFCAKSEHGADTPPRGGSRVKLGIRLQVLLALGSVLVLAFVPLYFAVASLTRTTLGNARAEAAVSLGRAVAAHVAVAASLRDASEVEPLLSAQLGSGGVAAVSVFDGGGNVLAKAAVEGWAEVLPASVPPNAERIESVRTSRGSASLVIVPWSPNAGASSMPRAPSAPASVAVLVRTDSGGAFATPLLRLVALYTGIVGLGLLLVAYFAMTRLVVRPIVELSEAARRVRDGGRRFEASEKGAAEVVDLSHSVSLMTERLRVEEEQLRKKAEEAQSYAEDLKRAQESLVRSERLASVGRLSAGLSHEIGNPLAAILGFQELMLMGGLSPEEERDFLERMKKETERIHRILRDLLDFARPAGNERATGESADRPSEVALVISETIALVRPQKDWKSIELSSVVDNDLPLIAIRHERLVQVLLNLLLNAGDVVSRDVGQVRIVAKKVEGATFGAIHKQRFVRLLVEDNGPGIPKEMASFLFEPFATSKDVGKGTGLGLAVCRGLVEAAGGTIGFAQSELGGAAFIVDLPAV